MKKKAMVSLMPAIFAGPIVGEAIAVQRWDFTMLLVTMLGIAALVLIIILYAWYIERKRKHNRINFKE